MKRCPIEIEIFIKSECAKMTEHSAVVTINVQPAAASPIVFTPDGTDAAPIVLPDMQVGVDVPDPGNKITTISGGVPPYVISVPVGAVPDGTRVNSVENADGSEDVFLAGTPLPDAVTQPGNPDIFTLDAVDSTGAAATLKVAKIKRV
jgi:hypothetical protein